MSVLRVASPPDQPTMLFDGDCGFCRFWVERWKRRTPGQSRLSSVPGAAADDSPRSPRNSSAKPCTSSSPPGKSRAARRPCSARSRREDGTGRSRLYRRLPGFAAVTELAYRAIAEHRNSAAKLTTLAWGRDPSVPAYARSTWLFLRILGAISLVAFLSLGVQIDGLVGENGILPARDSCSAVSAQFGTSEILARSDALLDLRLERASPRAVPRRGDRLHPADAGLRAGAVRVPPLGPLSFAQRRVPGVSELPVGHAAAGGAVSRDLSRSAAAPARRSRGSSGHRAWPRPLAALPPDVLLRRRQACQRRPDVAQPHGPAPPLRDAAAPDVDRLVRAPPSRESTERLRRGPVRRRARRFAADLRAAPASQFRARPARRPPGRDRPHRQLRVLQPPRDRALPARLRRPDAARPICPPPEVGARDAPPVAAGRRSPSWQRSSSS